MNRTKTLLALSILAGCSSTTPPTTPPTSWGVPISGGTMIVTRDGKRAVISDPDRDRLLVADLSSQSVKEIPLSAGDEPGRLVEDGAGRIHVALRRGGALLTLDGSNVSRRPACAEPRGLAWDSATDFVHLACSTGELITFPAAGGDAVRTLHLDRDLRDVIVAGSQLVVTRFRTAEMLTLDATGAIVTRAAPPNVQRFASGGFGDPAPPIQTDGGIGSDPTGLVDAVPAVAWRTIGLSDGRIVMVHQRHVQTMLQVTHGGYGQGCGEGPDESSIAMMTPGQAPVAIAPQIFGALPVDVAVDNTNTNLAFVLAGKNAVDIVPTTALNSRDDGDGCGGMGGGGSGQDSLVPGEINDQLGAPTSVAYAGTDLVVFYPEYPAIVVHQANGNAHTIALPGELGYDAGRSMFHTQTQSGLACASCHPEGLEDGQVWQFENEGMRRTQNLAGRIMDRAPYHWNGDMADLPTLMDDVFAVRMAGPTPTHSQHLSLGPFLDRVNAPVAPPAADADAVARGQALFESADTKCTDCHRGSLYSTKALVDVGTGGTFKVPSLLGVGARPPYMHDGCAKTLADRFVAPCGGGDTHGHTSQLTAAQISDLVAFLNTL